MLIAAVAALVLVAFWVLVAKYERPSLATTLLGSACWIVLFSGLSLSGVLSRFDLRPPPFVFMILAVGVVGTLLGRSRLFASVPMWVLVAMQSFRLPLELAMNATAQAGIMPVEMSFSGYNFDILSGVTAIGAAVWIKRTDSRAVAVAWNMLGSVLLLTIVSIAVLASPVIRAFGDGAHVNTFVAQFPYVFLPTVCVTAALALHVAMFKKLAL